MNQAVSFGLLFAGGILLTSALTGTSLADIVQGHPGHVGTTGDQLGGASGSSTVDTATGVGTPSTVYPLGVIAATGNFATSNVAKIWQDIKNQVSTSYTNPFASATLVTPERVDQGQDFSLAAGSPILAPGDSTFLGSIANWYQGQPYLAFRLNSGPLKGSNYYVAEQVTPAAGLKPGATVGQGKPIATFASSGTGLEIGWAGSGSNWTQTLAQQAGVTNSSTGHANTPAGQDFHTFLVDIGALS